MKGLAEASISSAR